MSLVRALCDVGAGDVGGEGGVGNRSVDGEVGGSAGHDVAGGVGGNGTSGAVGDADSEGGGSVGDGKVAAADITGSGVAGNADGERAVPGRLGCIISGPDRWTRLVVVVVRVLYVPYRVVGSMMPMVGVR